MIIRNDSSSHHKDQFELQGGDMLRFSEWRQPGKLGAQRGCILTITLQPVVKNNSNFYGKFIIKLSKTLVFKYFSFEQLKKVEKFSLYRLLRVDSFTKGWSKFKNTKIGGFKNSQIFTGVWWLRETHFILLPQVYLNNLSWVKNSRKPISMNLQTS